MLTYVEMVYMIMKTLAEMEIQSLRVSVYRDKISQVYALMNDSGYVTYDLRREEINLCDSQVTLDTRLIKMLFFMEKAFKSAASTGYELRIAAKHQGINFIEIVRPANSTKGHMFSSITLRPTIGQHDNKEVSISTETHANNELRAIDHAVDYNLLDITRAFLEVFYTEYGYDELEQ